jgi:hypothetical protein
MEEGPKPTGRTLELEITGCVFPWEDGHPTYLQVPGSDLLYLPLFSYPDKIPDFMARAQIPYKELKQVMDGRDFASSFPRNIKLMVDPYFTAEGRVRWSEVRPG